MKKIYLLISLVTIHFCPVWAQSVIHIENGANLFIQPQASVNLGGLVITPSGNLELTNISLERTATLQQPVTNNHIQRVYRFSDPVPAFSGIIRFYYEKAELNQLPEGDLTLNINNGALWQDFKINVIRNAQDNFVETDITAAVSLRELTLASVQAALPLKWGAVKGSCRDDIITIQWETLEEVNTRQFMVERSSNGTAWQTIQEKAAAGHSGASLIYRMEDASAINAPVWYYRVKSVDLDGSYSYSKTIAVTSCAAAAGMKLFPVPANTTVQLSFTSNSNQKGSIRIFNTQGQQVATQPVTLQKGTNLFSVDVRSLPVGTYYMQLVLTGQQSMTERFIKQ